MSELILSTLAGVGTALDPRPVCVACRKHRHEVLSGSEIFQISISIADRDPFLQIYEIKAIAVNHHQNYRRYRVFCL